MLATLPVSCSAHRRAVSGSTASGLPQPKELTTASVGSAPKSALEEIGIDISAHCSKAIAEIPVVEMDTVNTLCGEEECPLFLGDATRLHWGLPDPAGIETDEAAGLDAFRQTRDELRRRLAVVFVK
jgi:arsenate reductase